MENEPRSSQNKLYTSEIPPLDVKTRERLIEFLRANNQNPISPMHAEIRLERAGLIEVLEEAGILAPIENPNPIDITASEFEHDKWWAEHPTAGEAFDAKLRERDDKIVLLYLGAMIGPYMKRVPVPKPNE